MSLRSWIEKLVNPITRSRARRGRSRRHDQRPKRSARPWLEALETRLVPATITVTNSLDETTLGNGVSLREAIQSINAGTDLADVTHTGTYGVNDTILFSSSLTFPATITLSMGELPISKSVSILGQGADLLTISGGGASRVFSIASGNVTISGLKVTGGKSSLGGGIAMNDPAAGSTLTLIGLDIESNKATTFGGGVQVQYGTLNVINSTVANNYSADYGAGIEASNSKVTITNATIANNTTKNFGAAPGASGLAVFGTSAAPSNVKLESSTLSGNLVASNTQAADIAVTSDDGSTQTLTLHNTILNATAGNPAGTPNAKIFNAGATITSLGHNISSDGTGNLIAAGDFPSTSPFLGTLGLDGGATPTIPTLLGSPAIDKGDAGLGAPITDQRGAQRGATSGFGSIANAGTVRDIGAFEQSSLSVVTISDTSTTPAAYDTSMVGTLRGALDWANGSFNVTAPKGTPNFVRFDTTGTFATPQTITLTIGGLALTNLAVPEAIIGTGVPPVNTTNPITVSGSGSSKPFSVFSVAYLAHATITGITVTNGNAGSGFGGAVFSHGILVLTDVILSNNTASQGGAIDNNTAGTLIINDSTISGNSAFVGGALINIGTATFPATTIINNSTISGNTELNGFGIITNYPYLAGGISTLTINNSTITGNTGGSDAVESDAQSSAVLTLNNSTVAANPSGGLQNGGGTIITRNTILAGNTGFDVIGNIGSQGHNLIQNPTGGSGLAASDLLGVNPRLLPLAFNGGPTQTMGLGFGSPAIDAGDNTSAPANDQRGTGFARIINGTIDIGAFEDQLVSTAPASPQTAGEGSSQSFTLGSFSDAAPGPSGWSITILWGDGSSLLLPSASTGMIPTQTHIYAEEGTYTVTVEVADALGDTQQKTFTVNVSDPNVMATGGSPVTAAEGSLSATQTLATFTDLGGAEANDGTHYSASINWGDGTTPAAGTISLNGATFTVSGNHTYTEEGTYTITVTINHETTLAQTATDLATVSDPNVLASGGFPFSATEATASATQMVATFTDPAGPGALGDYSASINWGDGSLATPGNISLTGTTFTVLGSHTYAEEGSYPITVTINHEATTAQTATDTATVSDPSVVAKGGFLITAVEGAFSTTQTVATFTDPAGAEANDGTHYSASINWGDGSLATTGTISITGGSTTFTISGSHTYAEEGSYTLTVTVNHESSTPQSATSMATVANANVVASGGVSFSASEGTPSAQQTVATFTDPGGPEPLSDYSASISWGDGSAPTTGVLALTGTTFAVLGSHTYAEEGNYPITATINHEGTTPQTVTSSATVANPNVVAGGGFSFSASEGNASSAQIVATFTDPGGVGEPGDYSASISWGDGTAPTAGSITLAGITFTVSGSHTYGEEGTATISVTVNHENTPPQTVTSMAIISDPSVVGTALPVNAIAGAPFFNKPIANFTDPGGAEPNPSDPGGTINSHYQIVSINWGDSTPLDTSSGTLSFSGSPGSKTDKLTVSGSHIYAASGTYFITVVINHEGVMTMVNPSVTVLSLGPVFQGLQTRTSGFWNDGSTGQELIRQFTKTAGGQTLGQWLASSFPKLYGGVGGAPNLSMLTNTQVGLFYKGLFTQYTTNQLDAEVMALALYIFATTSSLGLGAGGTTPAAAYNLLVDANGLGAYTFNIGYHGAAFGVPNFTVLNVYQIMLATNNSAVGGEPWGTNLQRRNDGQAVIGVIDGDL